MEYELLTDNLNLLPFEFKFHDLYDGLILFFIDRPTPDTRIGIHEELKETPIQYYDVDTFNIMYIHAK